MLDLLGFWFNVTVITLALTSWLIWPMRFMLRHVVLGITRSENTAAACADKILRQSGSYTARITTLFGRTTLPFEFETLIALQLIALLVSAAIIGHQVADGGKSLLEAVSYVSQFCSGSYWIAILLAVYFGIMHFGRKLFLLSEKINKVVESKDS